MESSYDSLYLFSESGMVGVLSVTFANTYSLFSSHNTLNIVVAGFSPRSTIAVLYIGAKLNGLEYNEDTKAIQISSFHIHVDEVF